MKQCGNSSTGVDVAGRSAGQMNHTQHDELAQLFNRGMQLSQGMHGQEVRPAGLRQPPDDPDKRNLEALTNFASSHYTGSAHVRPDTTSEPSRSPPPPYNERSMPQAMFELLHSYSINASALLPNQTDLFQNADNEQRRRLLELWRIAPPTYPLEDHLNGSRLSTSLEREEVLARARYEHQMLRKAPQEDYGLDTHIPMQTSGMQVFEPASLIRESGEPAWPPAARMRAASIATNSRPPTRHGESEAYIKNRYQGQMSAMSIDPVYAAAVGLWQAPSYDDAVVEIRNYADWERMNQKLVRDAANHEDADIDDYDMEL